MNIRGRGEGEVDKKNESFLNKYLKRDLTDRGKVLDKVKISIFKNKFK